MRVRERLFITADGSRLVHEGDPAARYLWAPPGAEVSDAKAEGFGIVNGQIVSRKRLSAGKDKRARDTSDKGRK